MLWLVPFVATCTGSIFRSAVVAPEFRDFLHVPVLAARTAAPFF